MKFERSDSAGYLVNWAARLFARAIDRKLRPLGISSGHMPVFFALGDGAELTQKALTEIAAIEQPTMAATLTRMERDGLIQRRPDPADKRSALVSLTPLGLSKVQGVRAAFTAVNSEALDGLDEASRPQFLAQLRTVIATLDT